MNSYSHTRKETEKAEARAGELPGRRWGDLDLDIREMTLTQR